MRIEVRTRLCLEIDDNDQSVSSPMNGDSVYDVLDNVDICSRYSIIPIYHVSFITGMNEDNLLPRPLLYLLNCLLTIPSRILSERIFGREQCMKCLDHSR